MVIGWFFKKGKSNDNPEINITYTREGIGNRVDVISIKGYINSSTSKEVTYLIHKLYENGRFYHVYDLSNVEYITSSGFNSFMADEARMNKGEIILTGMNDEVREAFNLLEMKLESRENEEEGIEYFNNLKHDFYESNNDGIILKPYGYIDDLFSGRNPIEYKNERITMDMSNVPNVCGKGIEYLREISRNNDVNFINLLPYLRESGIIERIKH